MGGAGSSPRVMHPCEYQTEKRSLHSRHELLSPLRLEVCSGLSILAAGCCTISRQVAGPGLYFSLLLNFQIVCCFACLLSSSMQIAEERWDQESNLSALCGRGHDAFSHV